MKIIRCKYEILAGENDACITTKLERGKFLTKEGNVISFEVIQRIGVFLATSNADSGVSRSFCFFKIVDGIKSQEKISFASAIRYEKQSNDEN